MGCFNAKPENDHLKKLTKMVNELVLVYTSFEEYIRAQRIFVVKALTGTHQTNDNNNMDTSMDSNSMFIVSPLLSVEDDIFYFKQFKSNNKCKYNIAVSKFLKSINYCLFKLQRVFEQHSACLAQLNICKETSCGQKFINKNSQLLNSLTQRMLSLAQYLNVSPDFTVNLPLETSGGVMRTEGSLFSSSLIEIKSHSERIIPQKLRNL